MAQTQSEEVAAVYRRMYGPGYVPRATPFVKPEPPRSGRQRAARWARWLVARARHRLGTIVLGYDPEDDY